MALDVKLAETALALPNAQAAARVIGAFLEALGHEGAANANAPPPPPPAASPPVDVLAAAFEVLGIPATASRDEAKARYRELAKQWHPDRAGKDALSIAIAEARMREINTAYALVRGARGW